MQAQCNDRAVLAWETRRTIVRIPRNACQFHEFRRGRELIEIGRREAGQALDAAGY